MNDTILLNLIIRLQAQILQLEEQDRQAQKLIADLKAQLEKAVATPKKIE